MRGEVTTPWGKTTYNLGFEVHYRLICYERSKPMIQFIDSIGLSSIYFFVASTATIFLVLQFLLSLIGIGDFGFDGDIDADTGLETDSGDVSGFFSLRGILSFLSVFGWTGLVTLQLDINNFVGIIISIVAGGIMMFLVGLLFVGIHKLSVDNTARTSNALGKSGTVYLPVPKNRGGQGKITIRYSGAERELRAITEESEDLERGVMVEVVEVIDNGTVKVKKI